jgi:hypothetical protein
LRAISSRNALARALVASEEMAGFSMNKVLGTIKKRQTFIGSKGAFPCFFPGAKD